MSRSIKASPKAPPSTRRSPARSKQATPAPVKRRVIESENDSIAEDTIALEKALNKERTVKIRLNRIDTDSDYMAIYDVVAAHDWVDSDSELEELWGNAQAMSDYISDAEDSRSSRCLRTR